MPMPMLVQTNVPKIVYRRKKGEHDSSLLLKLRTDKGIFFSTFAKNMLANGQISKISKLICDTGAYIQSQAGRVTAKEIQSKDLNSFVSYVDKEAEKKLVRGLEAIHPGCAFLTEEETVAQSQGKSRWIIDPLDGTTNFLHGLPAYAVSVALEVNRKLVYGWIYHIPAEALYFAQRKAGAFCNGKRIYISERKQLKDCLLATGFPYTTFSHQDAYMQLFAALMPQCRGLRRLGSAALDLVYTARGIFDGFYEVGLAPWDVAAGALIVQEAGGVVQDFSGGCDFMKNQQILAATPGIQAQLQTQIARFY